MAKRYYVYIATNFSNTTLYIGMTNNIVRRMYEHKYKLLDGFTKRYNINKLVFCEEFVDPTSAIAMEKKLKGWVRSKKLELIKNINPKFDDFSKDWY